MSEQVDRAELIETAGPWPFTTRKTYRRPNLPHLVWRSRHHRKGLPTSRLAGTAVSLLRSLWMPRQLNWRIGVVFAAGSLLFMLGSVLVLAPALASKLSLEVAAVNAVFFAGSIPFTTAAYLQLYQSANAGEFTPQGTVAPPGVALFGWRPHDIGWLGCALQFLGAILFNVNTFDAMIPGLEWFQEDLAIWVPNLVGSILFLTSSYLAFIETCHAHWAWEPASLSWWVTVANLLGSVAFMISAVFAFVPPQEPDFDAATLSVAFTLVGAAGFLVGSLLMLPETAPGGGAEES